jgi:MFS family permease
MSSTPVDSGRSGWPRYYTVVLLLFAAVFISYIDRTNISVAAIAMQQDLGWTETDKGIVLSAFFIGYLLLMAASGALANRYGGWLGEAAVFPASMNLIARWVPGRIACCGPGAAPPSSASLCRASRWPAAPSSCCY